MIDVTKMNGGSITVNADLIETVEETPDTIITLTTGKKIIVKESRQEIKNLVIFVINIHFITLLLYRFYIYRISIIYLTYISEIIIIEKGEN